jgi:uncharacterized membrane protein
MKKIIIFSIFFISWIPVFILGSKINLTEQYKIIENLKTIFSILFALFGIWIAICNPLTSESEKLDQIKFDKILESLFLCITSLILISLIFFTTPILKQFHYVITHKGFFLGSLFVILYILTLLQAYTLIISLTPNNLIKDYLDRKKATDNHLKQQRILKK